ncbi:MAG TPA: class I SAM-dependent methyltransferase, partial [Candidatus Saccharimonadia bacterium]|nr:class I SAM-dependent methyltransferase [Candidatus Saccharimonadia bacterium]
MQHRVLEQELLDTLPHDDPDALASRLDIEFLNGVMGSFRWIRKQLLEDAPEYARIVELGAGDGSLIHHMARESPEMAARWTGLDLAPRPDDLPLGVQWVQGDFFQSDAATRALEQADVVVANLILHHFTDDQLRRLAPRLQHARLILVNEPARHWHHYQTSRLLNLICEFNHVTMYDMKLSIHAGFRTGELPRVLMLDPEMWDISENHSFFGSCRMRA